MTKNAAEAKPDGKTKSPSGGMPEGLKWCYNTAQKIPRRMAGDRFMCYVNYLGCTSIFGAKKRADGYFL